MVAVVAAVVVVVVVVVVEVNIHIVTPNPSTPYPLFLIIVSLPLLLGGCGEKVAIDVKNVEEKVLEVKEEVKNKESIVETNSELGGVNTEELEERENIRYLKDSETPYTGKVYGLMRMDRSILK